jgi:hypothetical protein
MKTTKTSLLLLTTLLLAPLGALHTAEPVTPPGDRNLPKAPNAAPAPICVQDVYEAVLGRPVDQAERAKLHEDALNGKGWHKGSLNMRNGIGVDRVFFEPGGPDAWGDQAIVYHGGEYHFYYLNLAPGRPLGHLVSKDGVFWKNAKPALECDPDMLSFNTPTIHSQKAGGPYILQYTNYHPVMEHVRRVAVSEDLVDWRRVEGLNYFLPGGDTLQRPGWGRYEANFVLLDGEAGHGGNLAWQEQGYSFGVSCGLHLQKSKDGIHWESAGRLKLEIPTPGEKQANGNHDTVTGFFHFKDRYFLVCPSGPREQRNYSRVYSSDRVDGTYRPTPHHSILGDFFAYYTRFGTGPDGSVLASVDYNESLHIWGGDGHTEHFVVPIFEKVVCDGSDLWLKYWPGNDILKAHPLPLQSETVADKGSPPLRLLSDTVDFSKGVVIEGEIRIPDKNRELDLARDAKVTATGTVTPADHPEAFLPQNTVDDRLDTRWVANAKDQPELTLDLGASRKIGRVRIHWTINWKETEVELEVSNDGQNWVPFPGKKHEQYVRFVSLYETQSPVEARFLRLKNFNTKRAVVGIGSVKVYEQPSEKLGANLQSPGLYIECQGGRQGWAIVLDDAGRLRMGYLNADGSSYNYEVERDLQLYGLGKPGERVKFRLIQRGRFFHFYLNDFAMSWISLREEPSGRVGILNDPQGKRVTAIHAWAAQKK